MVQLIFNKLNPHKRKISPNTKKGGITSKEPIINLDGEIWKVIEEFPNYEISNFGRVKNLSLNKIMTNCLDEDGYHILGLRKDNKRTTRKVHRLVAIAFIPNPNNLPYVNHIDHNRINNKVENLEWSSIKDNTSEAFRDKSTLSKAVIAKTNNQIIEFETIAEAANHFGITRWSVRYKCNHNVPMKIGKDWVEFQWK